MNKFFQRLFLFEKCEIQTKLSKQQVLNRIKSFADPHYTDYYGRISENGFFVAEKPIKHHSFLRTHNSFAPVARGKVTEKDGVTTVSMVLRMHLLVWILFIPVYIVSFLSVFLFPLFWIVLYFAFVKPSKRLKQSIEGLLIENEI